MKLLCDEWCVEVRMMRKMMMMKTSVQRRRPSVRRYGDNRTTLENGMCPHLMNTESDVG